MTWRRSRGTGRQADQWASPHERATTRAAERLDWPLEPAEAAWLDRHLAECERCGAIAETYEFQAAGLRDLRDQAPPPPRDLWARTAAAIEAEARRRPAGAHRRAPRFGVLPLGALSGALVVAVIVGASIIQGQPRPAPSAPLIAAPGTPRATVEPAATPLSVPRVEDVAWLAVNSDGEGELYQAPIDEVCPEANKSRCAPLGGAGRRSLDLEEAPLALVQSPSDAELVVVEAGAADAGGAVFVVPAGTPFPSATASPSTPPSVTAPPTTTALPPATATPTGTTSPTDEPTASIEPSASPTAPPSATPSPPVAGAIAIATDVVLVGEVGYSPDGSWFAFSARPADGSTGPDVFVWQAGEATARPLTSDHGSVFSSWLGQRVLASSIVVDEPVTGEPAASDPPPSTSPVPTASIALATPVPARSPRIVRSEAILIDPASGASVIVGSGFWRPTVDPTGRYAVYFDGSLAVGPDGTGPRPAFGRLVLGDWPTTPLVDPDRPATPATPATPGAPASGAPTASGSLAPVRPTAAPRNPAIDPGASALPDPGAQMIEAGTIGDWDARWDSTGTRLAIWVTDGVDPAIGRLSLYRIDPGTGLFRLDQRPVADVPALRGFSIADGRLAWVTPPGQDGEGSRVQILAWTADEFGSVETLPVEEQIVVIR